MCADFCDLERQHTLEQHEWALRLAAEHLRQAALEYHRIGLAPFLLTKHPDL